MRQVWITRRGAPEVLQVRETKDPMPQSGEALIRVKASGINFADILARKGLYPDAPKLPCVVGYEVAGEIEKIGDGVDESLVGKPVLAVTRFGGYSDQVILPAGQVFEKPKALSFEEAAALPVNYLTAYQLVIAMGGLKRDESVLIHNAGGGVGLAALELAKRIGAKTYGTASPNKHAFLLKRGLDHAIDYRQHDWLKILDQLTEDRGVELVLDPIGGSNWMKSYRALRSTGRLGFFGVSSLSGQGERSIWQLIKFLVQIPKFSPIRLMNANTGVFGVNLGHLWSEGGKIRAWMGTILQGVDEGWIHPHVDKSFPFDKASEAHRYIEERKNTGKVVLIP
ncbi:zinc-binding dehydrogenase [Candidatus Acetothermia bacterium]|nr:zinc-binding dehydrogenase [Candidatus Acetothermia bacterium]MBI3643872.1 zinc-binding dehydrogenase [Candidatus Acetothermia bacterium]